MYFASSTIRRQCLFGRQKSEGVCVCGCVLGIPRLHTFEIDRRGVHICGIDVCSIWIDSFHSYRQFFRNTTMRVNIK